MASVEELLSKQKSQLDALATLLDRELHLISVREPDQLVKVVNEKSEVLDAIQTTDKLIEDALKQRGDGELTESEQTLRKSIQAKLEQCKHCTAINQKAVEQGQLKLSHLRQLIVDIRARETLTYDKSGKATGTSSGKGISA